MDLDLIPDDKLKAAPAISPAPMLDFFFLMLAFFAVLAVTRITLFDTQLDLVQLSKEPNATQVYPQSENIHVNISITEGGDYRWITDIHDYPMETPQKVQKELLYQYSIGVLPAEKSKTQVLLHVDRKAPWEKIAKLIFAVREIGFDAHPVYQPDGSP
jgi:biopolymer transport protein ExbD